ncbi:hypothetical protein C4578_00980 [Candidatus Microgenomates bacterium]|nr:MAG: hypothetical protein C4578_00980 [Candidatus Microgenomates bacterium]
MFNLNKTDLPEQAKDIYREAFNSAWDQYKDPDWRMGKGLILSYFDVVFNTSCSGCLQSRDKCPDFIFAVFDFS